MLTITHKNVLILVNYILLNTVDNMPIVSLAIHVATSLQQKILCCFGVRIFIYFQKNNQMTIL